MAEKASTEETKTAEKSGDLSQNISVDEPKRALKRLKYYVKIGFIFNP